MNTHDLIKLIDYNINALTKRYDKTIQSITEKIPMPARGKKETKNKLKKVKKVFHFFIYILICCFFALA